MFFKNVDFLAENQLRWLDINKMCVNLVLSTQVRLLAAKMRFYKNDDFGISKHTGSLLGYL